MGLRKPSSAVFNTYFVPHKVGSYKTHGFGMFGTASNVNALTNGLDAFPFPVFDSSIVCDKMAVGVGQIATTGTHNTILGVYTDSNGFPGTLIATTGIIDVSTTGWKEATFTGGNITLTYGWYWIARLSGGNTGFTGVYAANAYPVPNMGLVPPDANYDQTSPGLGPHGVRYTYGSWPGSLPSTFPSIASGTKWLGRTTYASPFIRRLS